LIAGWLQLILAQLHLILAQLTSLVAINPGSLRSCLQVGAFMFAGHNRYRILLTMVHPKPIRMADMAREALGDLPLFKGYIRRYLAYEKASLSGVPVYEVKGDRMAKVAWDDYVTVGREIDESK
jgi:cellulose biosynthesis protein BcsQ